ncbi:MAG: hypothetical protein JSW61_06035 [Candidatus Thorarchaeota archaeon]|nr:MAG: hypothetical protein JSW61_06035 [Candidatus Thorarchaeota archaeon]
MVSASRVLGIILVVAGFVLILFRVVEAIAGFPFLMEQLLLGFFVLLIGLSLMGRLRKIG